MICVLVREWQRLLRAPSTPWLLAVFILVPGAIAAAYLQLSNRGPMGLMPQMVPMMGAQALSNVAAWQILMLAVWAPWVTGSMLAAELEERTLVPFLAGGGRLLGLVAGKFLAAATFFGLVILAGLPAFALPMLIGGISWGLMGRVAAMEGATVLLLGGIGLAMSALGRRAGSVAVAGLALGLALTLGTGLALGVATSGWEEGPGVRRVGGSLVPAELHRVRWLYTNPLVGLNSALDNGAPALLPLPGTWSGPVYKQFRLWQVQIAGAGAVGGLSLAVAWLALLVRLRWRRPVWFAKWRRRKAVAVSG